MSVVNEERNYTIYIHVCKENNKTYVGITCRSVEERWGYNGIQYKNQMFYRAIEKYGWDGFEHIILFENKTQEEAEQLEVLFIKTLYSNDRTYGYNIDNGGNRVGSRSKETKQKISETLKGREISKETAKKISNSKKGHIHSEETKQKISNTKKGVTAWNKGLKFSLKSRKKMSNSRKGKYIGGNHPMAKKVICENKIFDCAKDCAEFYQIHPDTFRNWLRTNIMPQKFIDLDLRYYYESNKNPKIPCKEKNHKARKIICEKNIFNCCKDVVSFYNIPYSTIYSWLNNINPTPQKYIDLGLRYYNPEVDGDIEQFEQYIETKAI